MTDRWRDPVGFVRDSMGAAPAREGPRGAWGQPVPAPWPDPLERHGQAAIFVTRRRAMQGGTFGLLLAGVWAYTYWRERGVWSFTGETGLAETRQQALPDGSRVTLGGDSAARMEYSLAVRRVVLMRGEARFEVMPEPEREFVVECGAVRIQALEARFTVVRHAGWVRAHVEHGAVELAAGPVWRRQRMQAGTGEVVEAAFGGDAAGDPLHRVAQVAGLDGVSVARPGRPSTDHVAGVGAVESDAGP